MVKPDTTKIGHIYDTGYFNHVIGLNLASAFQKSSAKYKANGPGRIAKKYKTTGGCLHG